jgi:putative Holliday junction resolvase
MSKEKSSKPRQPRRLWKIKPYERIKKSKKIYSRKKSGPDLNEVEGRVLGIDLGEKRVGLAISDPLLIIAQGLKTVERNQLLHELESLQSQYVIEEIVVGHPINLDGTRGEKAKEAEEYAAMIEKELQISVSLYDERFTTKEAERTLHEIGKKPSREKGKVNEISAVLILQGYLDSMKSE